VSELREHNHAGGTRAMNGFSIAALIYVLPSFALLVLSIAYRGDVGSHHMRRRRYDAAHCVEPSAPITESFPDKEATPGLDIVETDLFKIVIVERLKGLISR
jgi:hypothetical protein